MFRYAGFFLLIFIFLQACKSKQPQHIEWSPNGCVPYYQSNIKLHYKSITSLSYKINLGDSLQIEHYFKSPSDSVVVFKRGKFLTRFQSKNHLITSEVYQEIDSSGTLSVLDSFYISGKGGSKSYFDVYFAKNVKLSKTFFKNSKSQTTLYYSSKGTDSLYKEWYESGVLKTIKNYEYNSLGITTKKENKNYILNFTESGLKKSVSYDTLISGQFVRCVKKYYSNKKSQYVHFFYHNIPCHVWLDYSKEGRLLKTERKVPAKTLLTGPAESAPSEIYTYVEENSEFRGGVIAFQNYLEKELSSMNFTYPELLSGNYYLDFEIQENGKASFINLKGFQSDSIKKNLIEIITRMPAWKPRKIWGRPVADIHELILSAN